MRLLAIARQHLAGERIKIVGGAQGVASHALVDRLLQLRFFGGGEQLHHHVIQQRFQVVRLGARILCLLVQLVTKAQFVVDGKGFGQPRTAIALQRRGMAALHPLPVHGMPGFMGDLHVALQIPAAQPHEQ
ncbi:hypothetical protein D3C75_919640 [compost metagenome]